MTTRFHRDSSENLIVEIIKVIPETSKEKKWGGGGAPTGTTMLMFKLNSPTSLAWKRGGGTHYFWGICFPENSLSCTLIVTIFAKKM